MPSTAVKSPKRFSNPSAMTSASAGGVDTLINLIGTEVSGTDPTMVKGHCAPRYGGRKRVFNHFERKLTNVDA
jgi:hypothetical protein